MFVLPKLPVVSDDAIRAFVEELLQIHPHSITYPQSQGQMHRIIRLNFSDEQLVQALSKRRMILRDGESRDSLIIRVAAGGSEKAKLENEASVYIWLARNTTIPVPQILHHDSSANNPLGHKYMLMTHVLGKDGIALYKTLSPAQMDHVLDQLADHFVQLSQHPLEHIGGLRSLPDGGIAPGPVINEVHWSEPDIATHFPPGTLAADLNPSSPTGFLSWTACLTAYMRCYIYAIRVHPALSALSYLKRENILLLEHWIETINQPLFSDKLNDIPCIMAHRDLHFGQLLLDPQTCHITAVLDWEFAQVVPFPLWIKGFLWDGDTTVPWSLGVSQERKRLRKRWEERVRVRKDDGEGVRALEAQSWRCEEQKAAWDVVNYVRCIIEVTPRGIQADEARLWWDEVVKALKVFGIDQSSQ